MEFIQIQSFLAVAELLNFSQAAKKVFLSQPAVSHQIHSLEKELGFLLFERSHKKVELTPAGKTLYRELALYGEQFEKTVSQTRLASRGEIGRVRVGFISTAAVDIVPNLIHRFSESHPHVELELCNGLTASLIRQLERQQIDVAFFRTPYASSGLLQHIVIHNEPFNVFLPANHKLCSKTTVSLHDLDKEVLVSYARNNAPGYHDFLNTNLRASGAVPANVHFANDMYTLISMVSAGVGVAIAPASLDRYGLADVQARPIRDDIAPSQIAIAFHAQLTHPAARAFIDLALSEATVRLDARHDAAALAE